MDAIEQVHDFWFGELDELGMSSAAQAEKWKQKDPAYDALIRERFGRLLDAIAAREHEGWLETARGLVAYIVVLDQFSRNMHRDTPRAFAYDAQALEAAELALARGDDRLVAHAERNFIYMPLMHSESLEVQERCVALYEAWRDELPPGPARDDAAQRVGFAIRHRDIVARFGRYPHRNAILGRRSTPEEEAFLKTPGSSF